MASCFAWVTEGQSLSRNSADNSIDLFGLYILFSQYRSCDNTQEVWSSVLFIKMRACKHEYACMHKIYKPKRSIVCMHGIC